MVTFLVSCSSVVSLSVELFWYSLVGFWLRTNNILIFIITHKLQLLTHRIPFCRSLVGVDSTPIVCVDL